MQKQTLAKIRESIREGYLPDDWHNDKDDLIETQSGYYALNRDCAYIDHDYYHTEKDSDSIAWDDVNDEFILEENAVNALAKRGRYVTTHVDNCIELRNGDYVHEDYKYENNVVWVDERDCYDYCDNVYLWESDGEYHYDPEHDEDDNDLLWEYDRGEKERNYVETDKVDGEVVSFGFGMEIEKSELPDFPFDKWDVYNETGAVMERDGSVDDGFELKTPVYNLLSPKTDERLAKLKKFADIRGVENAGGHIGFSMTGKNDHELIDLCAGFIPLIFAMYKKRLANDYCNGKSIKALKDSGDKMQAIRMRGHYIEFRVIASVKSYNSVLFRLNFFRILAKNIGKTFSQVIGMAVNKNSELHKLLTSDVYSDPNKFERLIKDAIEVNNQFGKRKLTQKGINKIVNKLNSIKCA